MSEELKFSMPIVNEIPKWVIPTWCLSEKGKRGETVATVITFGTHIEQLTKLSKKEYERGRLATIKDIIVKIRILEDKDTMPTEAQVHLSLLADDLETENKELLGAGK